MKLYNILTSCFDKLFSQLSAQNYLQECCAPRDLKQKTLCSHQAFTREVTCDRWNFSIIESDDDKRLRE